MRPKELKGRNFPDSLQRKPCNALGESGEWGDDLLVFDLLVEVWVVGWWCKVLLINECTGWLDR